MPTFFLGHKDWVYPSRLLTCNLTFVLTLLLTGADRSMKWATMYCQGVSEQAGWAWSVCGGLSPSVCLCVCYGYCTICVMMIPHSLGRDNTHPHRSLLWVTGVYLKYCAQLAKEQKSYICCNHFAVGELISVCKWLRPEHLALPPNRSQHPSSVPFLTKCIV